MASGLGIQHDTNKSVVSFDTGVTVRHLGLLITSLQPDMARTNIFILTFGT